MTFDTIRTPPTDYSAADMDVVVVCSQCCRNGPPERNAGRALGIALLNGWCLVDDNSEENDPVVCPRCALDFTE